VIVALRSVGLGNERLFLDQKLYSLNVWNVFLGFRCGLAFTLTQHQTVFRFFAITDAPSRFSSLLLAFPSPLLLSESSAAPGQPAVWISRKVIPSLINQAQTSFRGFRIWQLLLSAMSPRCGQFYRGLVWFCFLLAFRSRTNNALLDLTGAFCRSYSLCSGGLGVFLVVLACLLLPYRLWKSPKNPPTENLGFVPLYVISRLSRS
jgi:hypothetical protein